MQQKPTTQPSIITGVIFLLASLFINYAAGSYATTNAGAPVQDILLNHLPFIPLSWLYEYGIIIFFLGILFLCIWYPKKTPFILKSTGLLIIVRSFFVVLTHIGPPPEGLLLAPTAITRYFNFTGDLFFSGHTGFPFLLSLLFWEQKTLRRVFLLTSIGFAVVVLLGHVHYSIDVFGAFFITYSTYAIAKKIFQADYRMFQNNTLHQTKSI